MISFILLIIGLILVLLEFYLPGAILGIIGGALIITSIIIFANQTSSALAVILFIIGTIIALIFLIRFALKSIVKAKPGYSIYSNKDQEGYRASSYDQQAIGKTGIVLSDLKPGGYILIEGMQHQALSVAGYIPKGEEVIVISGQEESLIVKLVKKE